MNEPLPEEVFNNRLIRNLDKNERPREKAMAQGFKALSNAELMALLFGTGIKGKSVVELCDDILSDNKGHLSLVTKMGIKELCRRYKGIGEAKAITLLAALELGARSVADEKSLENPAITSSQVAYDIMFPHFQRLAHEEFWVMLLSRSGKVIREVCVSQGGTAATVVDLKIIFKSALEYLASSIIVFHNHPSGNLRPSAEDDRLTARIKSAAEMLDIRLNDHIIVTDTSYYSYADEGRIV